MRIPLNQSPRYDANLDRWPCHGSNEEPCLVCGKAVKRDAATFVEMLTTCELPLDEEHTIEGSQHGTGLSQGWFPVGSDCLRKLERAAREAGGVLPTRRLTRRPATK